LAVAFLEVCWRSETKFPKGFFSLKFSGGHSRALGNPDVAKGGTYNLLISSSEGYLG
jgi:hypothetical protein